jgi:malonyl CoA-acyl carrier protein transacylase
MSLVDGLKVIARRARLIRDSWNPDKGLMMAVQADLDVVEKLLARANEDVPSDSAAAIACFNGPRSFTVAGSTQSMRSLEGILTKREKAFSSVQGKMLSTSHAFHSNLVEALVPDLKQITEDITFQDPSIRVERATMAPWTVQLPSTYIADHLRQPVCFDHAVQRLAQEFDNAVWLEAGSQSTVTRMVSKALGNPGASFFHEANLTSDGSWKRLSETTTALWKQGLNIVFWPHHFSQVAQYTPLLLPPYQFKKNHHYLDWKLPERSPIAATGTVSNAQPRGLWTFIGYQDPAKQAARFRVETSHETFQELMAGHTVARSQPLCPSTLQLDIATEAIRSLCPEFPITDYQIDLRHLENQAPLCRDPSRAVWLDVVATDPSHVNWSWKMTSNPTNITGAITAHASGLLIFRSRSDVEYLDEFRRFERLVSHKRCQDILNGSDSDDILQGSAIYKLFADVVDYSEVFRGVRKIVGRNGDSAGRVVKKYSPKTLLDTPLMDSFCQVAGAYVNCMTQRPDGDAFISTGMNRFIKSPLVHDYERDPEVFDVLALHTHSEDRSHYSSDVFVFDTKTSELLGVLLGIQYNRVSMAAMSRLLAHLTPGSEPKRVTASTSSPTKKSPESAPIEQTLVPENARKKAAQSTGSVVREKMITALAEMVGIEPETIQDDTCLPDLGIDSLMGMEVARELELIFNCTLDMSSMMSLIEFGELVNFVRAAIGDDSKDSDKGVTTIKTEDEGDSTKTPSSPAWSVNGSVASETPSRSRLSSGAESPPAPKPRSDVTARQTAINLFVAKYSEGFLFPTSSSRASNTKTATGNYVLITGATGSLGCQLVKHFAELASTAAVVCFNRPSRTEPTTRQRATLEERGISLDRDALAKLQVIGSDTSKPLLGLDESAYNALSDKVTHIIHCAWPMSVTRASSHL